MSVSYVDTPFDHFPTLTAGQPLPGPGGTITFSYQHIDTNSSIDYAVHIEPTVTFNGASLNVGDAVGPIGLTVTSITPKIGATPASFVISGTPTVPGVYAIYVKGTWTDPVTLISTDEARPTYTVTITGSALTTNPASGATIIPSATVGQNYLSNPFTISNGSGSYNISVTGAPSFLGVTDSATPGTGVSSKTISGNTFYLANNSQTPSSASSSTITVRVHDNQSGAADYVPTFTFNVVTSGGGTISITEVAGGSTSCVQEHTFTRTYSASGGNGTYNWGVSGGTGLPAGLITSQANNRLTISGIPTAAVTSTSGQVFTFNVNVTDTAAATGTVPISLTLLPGAGYTGGPLPNTVFVNTAYTPTTLTAIGGDGTAGQYTWHIRTKNNVTSVITPGVPPGMTIAQGFTTVSGYALVLGLYATFQGTPNTAGFYSILAQPFAPVGTSKYPGDEASFPVNITGVPTITISPGALPSWTQHISQTVTLTAVGGTPAYLWAPPTGLPSGISSPGGTLVTTTLTGGSDTYSSSTVGVSVTDSLFQTGGTSYSLVIAPDIWVVSGITGSALPPGVKGSAYNHAVVFDGGDRAGFSYTVTNLPGGITATPSGTGNNTLTFFENSLSALAGTYPISVKVTVPTINSGGSYSKTFLFSLVVTGAGTVNLVPFATLLNGENGFVPFFPARVPYVKIGAVVTGGTTNTYTVTTVPSGWVSQLGGDTAASNQGITYAQDPHVNGDFTFVLTSDEDGTAQKSVVIRVITGNTSVPSITPSTSANGGLAYNLYSGQSKTFTASMPDTLCGSNGLWSFVGGGGIPDGVTFSPQRGGATTVLVAAGAITVPKTMTLEYRPDEDPSTFAQVLINLIPGVSTTTFQITNSSLSSGAVSSPYSLQLNTSGGTGSSSYNPTAGVTWQALPTPLTLSGTGLISGTPTLAGTGRFTVTTKDSASTPLWTSKTFDLFITSGGAPTILSVAPNFGPIGGGTTVVVTGTGFVTGQKLAFAVPGVPGFLHANATGNVVTGGGTIMTSVTPAWSYGAGLVDVYILDSAGTTQLAYKSGAFTYGGADFTVGTFSPTSANVGDSDKVITVFGTNFDSSCSIKYTRSDGGGEQTLSGQLFISGTSISGTIASSNFGASHAGTTATIKVTKSDGSFAVSTTQFQVIASSLDITTSTLPNATRGSSYSQALAATGGSGSYTWAIAPGTSTQPPTGITLTSGGVLTATTVDSGATSSTFTVEVTDSSSNKKDKVFTIIVSGGGISITTTSPLPTANINSAYDNFILASGGVLPYTFTRVSGNIPLGIVLDTDGRLHGTATTANAAPQSFSFSVRVTDSTPITPLTTTKAFALQLNPALSAITITSLTPSTGPLTGGTPVTIAGTGFQAGCSVQFRATSATSVQFVSGTSIIATTPPSATAAAVSVFVRNPDGGNQTFSSFTYQVLTSPNITSIDRQDGPFAGGQTVVLSGDNFQGISAIKFGITEINSVSATFDPGTISLGTSPQTVSLTTPPGTTFGDGSVAVGVNIYVTNASGTGVWPIGDNGYTYRPPPIITTVVPNTGPTSGGQTVYVIGSNFFQRGANKPRVFIGNVEVPASSIVLVEE